MKAADAFRLQEYQDLGPLDGQAHIHLKRHPFDGRICLEKRILKAQKEIYQFLQEQQIPGVPHIDLCVEDDETLIVIEKYIEGMTLAEVMEKGPMEWRRLLPIVDCLCQTLEGLHQGEKPVICRDLKAENIIIDCHDKPWLVDFDISRIYQAGKKRDTELLGTAEYAAPEQFGFFQTDPRTDIYSLGVLMNYMATCRFPVEEMAGGTLGQIIRKCTYLEPDQRYQSIAELKGDLIGLERDLGMIPADAGQGEKVQHSWMPPGFRRRKPPAMILAALSYALLTWFCFSMPITVEDTPLTGMALAAEQAVLWLSQILWIFLLFRYRGWGNNIPLLRSGNLLLRILGLILAAACIIIGAACLCILMEVFFL